MMRLHDCDIDELTRFLFIKYDLVSVIAYLFNTFLALLKYPLLEGVYDHENYFY
jgi:hypothetical protein